MKHLLTFFAVTALALPMLAETEAFRGIVGDAANIQRDAEALSSDLKQKNPEEAKVKSDIAALNASIAKLKQDVTEVESKLGPMSDAQKKDWELVKTKVELLTIFAERKAELANAEDWKKNRSVLRAHATGIAKRAAMLQQTASRLR